MLSFAVYNLLPLLSLAASLKPNTSSSHNDLVAFISDGFNNGVDPCDNFYDFVCGNHSSSSHYLLRSTFQGKMLKLIAKDTKYPTVSKALLDYIADCVHFLQNKTYKLETMRQYMESVVGVAKNTVPNFFESLLKVVFPAPELPGYGVFSPTELLAAFSEDTNRLSIWADPTHEHVNNKDFYEQYEASWFYYSILTIYMDYPEYKIIKHEKDMFSAFADKFRSIIATSNSSLLKIVRLKDIKNQMLQKAIINTVPYYWDEQVNMASLYVSVDENMFDQLQQLFARQPREGRHFLICMALSTAAFSIEIIPKRHDSKSTAEIKEECFNDALNPKKSGAVFNLYAANLMIRNNFSMTTVSEQLAVRNIVENIRFEIRKSLISASWLQNDRQMLRDIDTLLNISKSVGLPEEVYNETRFSAELSHFSGFYRDDDMIQKILRLRFSNTRLVSPTRNLGAPSSYFEINAQFDWRARKLNLLHMILLAPYYSSDYPISYNYGFLGSIIGHEFFHQFSPPYSPRNWLKYSAHIKATNCYVNFYNDMCYNLTQETSNGDKELNRICADGKNDLKDNIPDVEGARAAYQAMKYRIGEKKLKERAIAELDFTNEQMFFVARAQFYCDKMMNDHEHFSSSLQDGDDSHAAERVRVNAISMQMEEFQAAFSCKPTDSMVIDKQRMCYLLPSS